MRIVEQASRLLWITPDPVKAIELAARTCYKSEDKITDESAAKMVAALVKRGHDAMIEHACASVHVVTDRGITHEFVRHRIASFAQESTRYVNYAKGKQDRQIGVVKPLGMTPAQDEIWFDSCLRAEADYMAMIDAGCPPEVACDVLPTCTKTELVITCNFREWRHFFKLRKIGATGKPHPKMRALACLIWNDLITKAGPIFDDLKETQPTVPLVVA
jgi:thymidylate synthase (FAD)